MGEGRREEGSSPVQTIRDSALTWVVMIGLASLLQLVGVLTPGSSSPGGGRSWPGRKDKREKGRSLASSHLLVAVPAKWLSWRKKTDNR